MFTNINFIIFIIILSLLVLKKYYPPMAITYVQYLQSYQLLLGQLLVR